MLSSFINRRKGKKISLWDATIRRVPLPPSPDSFSTPDLPEPLDNNSQAASPSKRAPNPLHNFNQAPTHTSPQVHLDFKTGVDDWFSRDLFGGVKERRSEVDNADADRLSKHAIRTSDDVLLIQAQSEQSQPSLSFKTVPPSPFPHSPIYPPTNPIDLSDSGDHLPLPGVARKPAPAPLKIPNNPITKVQVASSTSVGASGQKINPVPPNSNSVVGPSPATSFISSEDMSSISGTTLARALIANTFIIPPSDNPRMRHRSGGITRQDSATLPKGESPYSKDKRISGGETPQSSSNSAIPPVPPLPQNIDDLGKHNSNLRRSRSASDRSQSVEGLRNSKHLSSQDRPTLQRRISRISEASTPDQSAPNTPERKGDPTSVMGSSLRSDSLLSGTSKGTARTENSGFSDMAPTSAGSADDIDNVLSGFQFSPLNSSIPSYLNSDITENPLSNQSSAASTASGRKSSNESSRRSTQTSMKRNQLDFKSVSGPGTIKARLRSNSSSLRPQALLPIGERPQSLHIPVSPVSRHSNDSSNQSLSSSIGSPDLFDYMFPQNNLAVSTPSHPKVIRIGAVPELDLDASITSASEESYRQTFPETPDAFSPLWYGPSPMYARPGAGYNDQNSPGLPRSASIRGNGSQVPPKRSASLSNAMATRIPPSSAKPQMSPIPATPSQSDSPLFGGSDTTPGTNDFPDGRGASSADMSGTTSESTPITSSSGSSAGRSMNTTVATSPDAQSVNDQENAEVDHGLRRSSVISGSTPGSDGTKASSSPESSYTVDSNSTKRGKIRVLPKYPKPPPIEVPSHTSRLDSPVFNRRPSDAILLVQQSNQSQSEQPSQLPPESLIPIVPTSPVVPSSAVINPSSPARALGEDPVTHTQVPSGPTLSNTHPSNIPRASSPLQDSYDISSTELPAPPPSYQHAIQCQPSTKSEDVFASNPAALTYGRRPSEPSTSSVQPESTSSPSPNSSPQRSLDSQREGRNPVVPEASVNKRPARSRPIGPAGPRKQSSGVMATRNSSVTSMPGDFRYDNYHASRKSSVYSMNEQWAPRFQAAPVRWRGIPMDVAKWTFSSQQLQDIVSRAIKQSAEPHSIRLLKIETLDQELPEEMHRLEMQATEIKGKFKQSMIRRKALVNRLRYHVSGMELVGQGTLNLLVEELQDVSATIERLADDLYHVTDQTAQLKRLRDSHSIGALAIALRKLNTSFLRQATETQMLRDRVVALESERDTAWIHAEHVAQEYDELMEQSGKSTPVEPSSRRSSRMSAVRKSSLRLSKAGFKMSASAHRKSLHQQNSMSTPHLNLGVSSAPRPVEVVPPVPPMPSRLPASIQRNRSQESTGNNSYHDFTPSTESRALAQAQRELCEMLGIDIQDDIKNGRARSFSTSDIRQSGPSVHSNNVRRNSDIPESANGLDDYLDPISGTVSLESLAD